MNIDKLLAEADAYLSSRVAAYPLTESERACSSALDAIVKARRAIATQQAAKAETAEQAVRTDEQIVRQTEDLAAEFARIDGYRLEGESFRDSSAPRCRNYWERACIAQRMLTSTDPEDAVSGMDDTDSSDLAPTTSTVSASDAIRNAALEEAAKVADETSVVTWGYFYAPEEDGYATRDNIAESIRALKSTAAQAVTDQAKDKP